MTPETIVAIQNTMAELDATIRVLLDALKRRPDGCGAIVLLHAQNHLITRTKVQ